MCFEKFHKVGFAVVGQFCHVIDGDAFVIVFFHIFEDGFQLFQSLGLGSRFLFHVFFIGYEDEEKME